MKGETAALGEEEVLCGTIGGGNTIDVLKCCSEKTKSEVFLGMLKIEEVLPSN